MGATSASSFAQRHLRLVVVIGGDVKKPRRLLGDGAHDIGMRMAGRGNRDAGAEIQIHVAVDILDDGAFAARHDKRCAARIRRRHHGTIALENRARAGTRRRDFDIWNAHVLESQETRSLGESL